MRFLGKLFIRGLAAILPLALTGYLAYWAVFASGTMLKGLIEWIFPSFEVPLPFALGIAVVLVMAVGLLMYTVLARVVYDTLDRALQRIPVVKSVYGMVVDVMRMFGSSENRPFRKVVLVRINDTGTELLGFITRETFDDLPSGFAPPGCVCVYLPMSYQIGGFTVVVPRGSVREIEMGAEQALRWAVTGGVAALPAPVR